MTVDGLLTAEEAHLIRELVGLRFVTGALLHPELVIMSEQHMLPEEELHLLAEGAYGCLFDKTYSEFISKELIDKFRGTNYIPLNYTVTSSTLRVGTLCEYKDEFVPRFGDYKYELVLLSPQLFFQLYHNMYGDPPFCLPLPPLDLFRLIMTEAILEKASDVTFASRKDSFQVYYNINKRKVRSQRVINADISDDMRKLILAKAGASTSYADHVSSHGSIDINENYRGRCEVTSTFWGFTATIRLLPNTLLNQSLEDLSMSPEAIEFIRDRMISLRPGLKLWCGPTMSGKNTTILSALCEIRHRNVKIISVENPVEILTDFIEQINTETVDEYAEAVASLIRHNPDLVYITEMMDRTAQETMKIANTGKAVFSTIHTNSVSGVLSRIMDLTGLSIARVIENLDCVFYQLLVPRKCKVCDGKGCAVCHKAGMLPVVEYLEFTPTIKKALLGLDLAECLKHITALMEGKTKQDYAKTLVEADVLSEADFRLLLD